MAKLENLKIKIFMDGANVADLKRYSAVSYIKGFTTNPSLMRKAGVLGYEQFIEDALRVVNGKPICFEVISDDFQEMKKQAMKIDSFGKNVFVKIPVMNTKGESSVPLINDLTGRGVKINVTAVMTLKQIEELRTSIDKDIHVIISIFAGRIADTGVNPVSVIKQARNLLLELKNVELLWASPREVLNIFQAEEAGCDIITLLPDLLRKIHLVGYDLNNLSLDTVKMFYNDAVASGFKL